MKALVSGGAGFIGSHLCEVLLSQGHQVTAVDNLITGTPANVAHLNGNSNFKLVVHDVVQPLVDESHDLVFHLASPASPVGYGKHPVETMLVNSQGTYQMLELARRHGARFLLASTSEVYGDPLQHPQPESYWGNVNPVGPRACYDEGKRFAEALTITYLRLHSLDARIVRIFNTYGPRNHPEDGRIIPNFMTQALRGQPLTVYGDGLQTRSFCYVSDLVEGIMRTMFTDDARGQVINLGNPEEHTVLEIAQIIQRLTGTASPIVHTPAREEEITRRRPDIAKAQKLLGWSPQVSLEQGLSRTLEWFKGVVGTSRAIRISRGE